MSHTSEGHYGRWERVKDNTNAAIWLTGANRQERVRESVLGLSQDRAMCWGTSADTPAPNARKNTETQKESAHKFGKSAQKRERLWRLPLELMNVTPAAQKHGRGFYHNTHTHTHTHDGIATQRNHRHSGSKRVYQIKGMFRVQYELSSINSICGIMLKIITTNISLAI